MAALLLLFTLLILVLAPLMWLWARATQRFWLKRFVACAALIWFGIYALLLIGFSVRSRDRTLPLNEPKAFCGFYLDCHLHAAIVKVEKTGLVGAPGNQLKPRNGVFYIVTVKITSDARLTRLKLLDTRVSIVTDTGRNYSRDLEAESAHNAAHGDSGSLESEILPPGLALTKDLIFDLAGEDEINPRLLMTMSSPLERVLETFLIDDEDSLFHGRTYFNL